MQEGHTKVGKVNFSLDVFKWSYIETFQVVHGKLNVCITGTTLRVS